MGTTASYPEGYEAAARVCLDRHHKSPVQIPIGNNMTETPAQVEWQPADDRTRASLNNEIDTTEAGAYACVIAAVALSEGLFAVGWAETCTGAGYHVGSQLRLPDLNLSCNSFTRKPGIALVM